MFNKLTSEIAKAGIALKEIAEALGIPEQELSDKLSGNKELLLEEAEEIVTKFFPDVSFAEMFDMDLFE